MQNSNDEAKDRKNRPLALDYEKHTYFVVTVRTQYPDPEAALGPNLYKLHNVTLTLHGTVGPDLLARELVVGVEKQQMIQNAVSESDIVQRLKDLDVVQDVKIQTSAKRSKRTEVCE